MNISLKWSGDYLSSILPLPLFNLEIFQEENNFAKARLVIDAIAALPPTGTEGIIVLENNDILFKGLLVGSLVNVDGAFGEIELIGKPIDFLCKTMILQKENRVAPYWDGLWIPPDKSNNFEEIQDVRSASLFCHPRTGELMLSDWFEGRKIFTIHEKFSYESLQVKLRKPPLQACTVKVHAHWVQWLHGISNLGPQIRKAFPYQRVNTYTEKAIVEKWPRARKRLGRSGLWVLKSELKPINPPSTLYPTYSSPLFVGERGETSKTYRVKRYWFKPILWVRWQKKQKRKETLSLTLTHDFQYLYPGEGEHKTVEFTLQNINPDPEAYPWQPNYFYPENIKIFYKNAIYRCKTAHISALTFEKHQKWWTFKKFFHTPLGNPARESFFLTTRGYQAAEHAMERAKVILAKSARCLEVSFEGSWDELKEITTDSSAILKDPRLPGGVVQGKVVKCLLSAKGETGERTVHVTLLCSVGTGKEVKVEVSPKPLYGMEGYGEEDYQVHENQVCRTPSGLSYFRYDAQAPSEGLGHGLFLRGVQLINGPQEQEAEMTHHSYGTPRALKKAIEEKPTGLNLFFKDLRTKERVDQVITVKMAAPWSAPRQFMVG